MNKIKTLLLIVSGVAFFLALATFSLSQDLKKEKQAKDEAVEIVGNLTYRVKELREENEEYRSAYEKRSQSEVELKSQVDWLQVEADKCATSNKKLTNRLFACAVGYEALKDAVQTAKCSSKK